MGKTIGCLRLANAMWIGCVVKQVTGLHSQTSDPSDLAWDVLTYLMWPCENRFDRTAYLELADLTVSRVKSSVTGAARAVYGNSSGAKQARLQHLFVRSSASGRHWDIGWECRWITAMNYPHPPVTTNRSIGGVNPSQSWVVYGFVWK